MNVSIVWFRRDLRLQDNEAVCAATQDSRQTIFVFVIDPWFYKQPEIGWLRVKFLFESLAALDGALQAKGNKLLVLNGNSVSALTELLTNLKQDGHQPSVYFNYDIQVAYGRERDEAVLAFCKQAKIAVTQTHNYFLLHDESQMNHWWKSYYDYQSTTQLPVSDIHQLNPAITKLVDALPHFDAQHISVELGLTLPEPRQALFGGGELAGRQAVYDFLKSRVNGYHWKISRPFLAQNGATSLLGPHLAFGTVSTRTVFQSAANHMHKVESRQPKKGFDIANYLDRLRWRDSFTQRLWFHPELIWQNRFPEFDGTYNESPLTLQQQEYFERWQQGQTGFPLLDAAMKQLAADGFINFRMRAMAATFLTINCGVSWHHGARHFMNCLVDGDIAINHWQWQMQAGITNPLSPVFRMYDPTKNLRDRDPNAQYVHFWLPETKGQSVENILHNAKPMLDFKETRKANGKIIADLRKQVRTRVIAEKGLELDQAKVSHRVTTNYKAYSAERYKQFRTTTNM